jgi:hypothetical protein
MIFNYMLILIVLLLFAGLGLDAGTLEWRYLQMQAAVRAAAISGSLALQRGGSSSTISAAGLNSASLNGFTNGSNGVTVTIQNPPTAGTYSGNSYSVRSLITQSVTTSFMSLVGFPKVTLSALFDQPGATSVSLTSAFNVNAIFRDTTNITNGGFDTSNYSYSANAMDPIRTSAGLGPMLSWRGNLFFLGPPDVVNGASNVTVSLTQAKFSQLMVLASVAYGPEAGTFVVTYTDGSTATSYFSMSDWCTNYSWTNEVLVHQSSYRDGANQTQDASHTPFVYGYTINLTNTKTVKSVALPPNRNAVIFAMDLVP